MNLTNAAIDSGDWPEPGVSSIFEFSILVGLSLRYTVSSKLVKPQSQRPSAPKADFVEARDDSRFPQRFASMARILV